MSATVDFLSVVLPDEGLRCLFVLPERRHYWFTTNETMAASALRFDAVGRAVYHANATFTRKSRKQADVAQLQSLFLDVDAGLGKPYGDARRACGAVEAWRGALGLPRPLYVVSGGGVHAYWPLGDPLDRPGWERAAHRLRVLAQEGGLAIDPGITIDAARVLRPPGTHNRKLFDPTGKKVADVGGPARPVVLGNSVQRYDNDSVLSILFAAGAGDPPLVISAAGVPPGAREAERGCPPAIPQPGESTLGAVHGGEHDPSDLNLASSRCMQLAAVRESRGNVPEPLWYAALGVLGHGTDGVEFAHAWSQGHPGYSAADTTRKLRHALEGASGPTTCARFAALNPLPCSTCRHAGQIVSPIQLGRDIPAATLAPKPPGPDLPALPTPYFWERGKLKMKVEKATPEQAYDSVVISDYPVYAEEFQRGERSEGVSAVFRSWEPMANAWTLFPLALKDVLGERGLSSLAHHGVAFNRKKWPLFQNFVVAQVNEHRALRHYGLRFDQFGWKDTPSGVAFALGEELLTAAGTRRAFGSPEFQRRGRLMRETGSLVAWRHAVEMLFRRPGMEGHAFALLCSFASVLYPMTGALGGTVVHLASIGSGTGKSTALDAISSVWGALEALQLMERDTITAKFISCGILSHLPVVFDELRSRDPELIKEFILHYTLGRDKMRGAAEGGLRSDSLPWSNILISAANISLVDTLKYDDAEVAQAAGVFEFEAKLKDPLPVAEAEALKAQLKANAGTAGRAFLRASLADHDAVKAMVEGAMTRFSERLGGGEQRYLIRLLAVVAVAGHLVRAHGILDLPLEAILDWAVGVATGGQGHSNTVPDLDLGDIVGRLINDMLPATLVMPAAPRPGPQRDLAYTPIQMPRGELQARYDLDSRRLWIDEKVVRRWLIDRNYPVGQLRTLLLEQRVLVRAGEKKTLAAGADLPKSQVRVWEIDGTHPQVAELVEGVVPANVVSIRGAA